MARVSPDELLGRLEKGTPIPAILLLGEEPYLRDACRTQLIARFVPEASRTWAVSRYSAERGETQAAFEQAQTLPMLSPQQVVFLEDVEAIEKLGEKNRDEAVAQREPNPRSGGRLLRCPGERPLPHEVLRLFELDGPRHRRPDRRRPARAAGVQPKERQNSDDAAHRALDRGEQSRGLSHRALD
jgi:hypothetical protein